MTLLPESHSYKWDGQCLGEVGIMVGEDLYNTFTPYFTIHFKEIEY
jgi:hypothetical protein